MSDVVIRGLTIDQYANFSAEANAVRQKWDQSGRSIDIKDDMLNILNKYNQDPANYSDEDGLNFEYVGWISEWQDTINQDPEMMMKFSQIQSAQIQQNMFGDSSESAGMDIEGISLEKYAETAAKLQNAEESEHPAIVSNLGYTDMDHYQRVSDGFTKAMEQDLKIATHFGTLFAQYGSGHMAATEQFGLDALAETIDDNNELEDLEEQALQEIMKRAASGQAGTVVDYLKSTFPDDADDNDSLDWHIDRACDQFAESGNRDAAKALLEIRWELQEDEDEPKDEWVADKLEMLFL